MRGFEARSLGPVSTDSAADPLGGGIRTVAGIEIYFPIFGLPEDNDKRLSLFMDSGQVFASSSDVDFGEIRLSVGAGFHWFSPVGPISFTVAQPLNDEPGDDVKRIQFTLGSLLR